MKIKKLIVFNRIFIHPDIDPASDDFKKNLAIVIYLILVFLVAGISGVDALRIGGHVFLAWNGVSLSFVALVILIISRITGRVSLSGYLACILSAEFSIFLFYTGGLSNVGHVWFFVTVPLFILVLGHKKAIVVISVIAGIQSIRLFFPDRPYLQSYDMEFVFRYFLAIVFMMLFTFFLEDLKNKAQKERDDLISELKTQVQQKEMLMKEIHHRVKNNFTIIQSLLSLQEDGLRSAKAIESLRKSEDRLHTMALIHEQLYSSDSQEAIDVSRYIDDLANTLISTYGYGTARRNINLDVQSIVLDFTYSMPLGLILNEIITNALKYAFPDEREGVISINLHKENERVHLTVKDNGIGLPENFDISKQRSLGMTLISTLTDQLNGHIDIRSDNGTRVELTFDVLKLQ